MKKPWLEAVRAVAEEAALAEDRQRVGGEAGAGGRPAFAYRWEHVQQVVRNGRWLLARLPADAEVLLAACWLHDSCKREAHHAARGAEFAREFLPETDFPAAKIEAVAAAIAAHEGLWRPAPDWHEGQPFRPAPPLTPIETALLWDADKLAKIGPVALLHFQPAHLQTLQRKGEYTTTESILARNRHWLDHYAPRILASFNSLTAQQEALRRHAAFELFWQSAEAALAPVDGSEAG